MGFFSKPEVTILKESSDAKKYLSQLEDLKKQLDPKSELANQIDKEIAITQAGIAGEDAIMFELKYSGMDLVVLHDLYIESSDGKGAQIDFLVITPYVTVMIECKNLFGDIEINSRGDFIRTFTYRGRKIKEGIYSPITQNERHMTVFRECLAGDSALKRFFHKLGFFSNYNKSLVVLANPKTVLNDRFAPKDIKKKVIRRDQLISTLLSMKSDVKSSKKEMIQFGENYLSLHCDSRNEYIDKFQKMTNDYFAAADSKEAQPETDDKPIEKTTDGLADMTVGKPVETTDKPADEPVDKPVEKPTGELADEPVDKTINNEAPIPQQQEQAQDEKMICPRCGKELVLRTARKGAHAGKQFYGCSGFPHCRFIKEL